MLDGPDDLPPVYYSADRLSIDSQRLYLGLHVVELAAIAGSAVVLELSWRSGDLNITALIGFGLLLASAGARIANMVLRPERSWYDARALAESVKTMSWQFAVRGSAFPSGMAAEEAERRFVGEIHELREDLTNLDLPPTAGGEPVTAAMRKARASDLADRRVGYQADRIRDQLEWYNSKAELNRKRSRHWSLALLALEVSALMLALLRGLGLFGIDWAGVVLAWAAATLAWRQIKQYDSLAEAYSVTTHDVSELQTSIANAGDEWQWAEAVHDAESAFSREHTQWRARRQR